MKSILNRLKQVYIETGSFRKNTYILILFIAVLFVNGYLFANPRADF